MKYKYCLKNFEHGYENDCRYMMLALYKNGELISIERVKEEEPEGSFDFCRDTRMGSEFAFDVLADSLGEDAAFNLIDEYCFEACWEAPEIPQIIDGEAYLDIQQAVAERSARIKKTDRIDLDFIPMDDFTLWDEEGIKRFAKCFEAGAQGLPTETSP